LFQNDAATDPHSFDINKISCVEQCVEEHQQHQSGLSWSKLNRIPYLTASTNFEKHFYTISLSATDLVAVSALLKINPEIEPDAEGRTASHWAVSRNRVAMTKYLLQKRGN